MTMSLVAVGRVLLPSFSGCCCSCLVFKRSMGGYSSCLLKSEHYDRKATKYWNDFYKRHHNKFFKDRHYLEKEWGQYFSTPTTIATTMNSTDVHSSKVVLEVGCGAGNTLFPLLDAFPNLFIHACDFSPNAISLVKSNEDFREDQVNAFVCDLTRDDLCQRITPSSVDVVTLFLQKKCLWYCRI
ncbi:hypothetical protein AQUCO_01500290v1 [Aquilegia coerulea]|uniref:Methyltransferase type 12 domain-containing protein n=1 Tax=Aquilegia coerulea TaxID=218851 RepID=A0A2G5DT01_AQUCA|nr:hypothetical protein AQUCO_01500290v1 [Aquilegia coerulea]